MPQLRKFVIPHGKFRFLALAECATRLPFTEVIPV